MHGRDHRDLLNLATPHMRTNDRNILSSVAHQFSVLDLYSGPGGFSLGFSMARSLGFSFKIVAANDVDPNAIATYKKNHPKVNAIHGSLTSEGVKERIIRTIGSETGRKTVDLVIGGPPCKGFSVANKMTRDNTNELNYLAMHFVEMVKRTRPFAFVMENVPGMLSLRGGEILDTVKGELVKEGYENTTHYILDASDYGVPQKRKRMFLIGSLSSEPISMPKKTHGTIHDVQSNPALEEYVTAGDAISDLPIIPKGKAFALTDEYACDPKNPFQDELRRDNRVVKNHRATVSNSLVVKRFQHVRQGGNWRNIPKKLMRAEGKYLNLDNMHSMIYKRLDPDKPSVTVTNFRKAMLVHPTQNRLLSVREAARMQTFPDYYEFEGGMNSMQQQVSDAVPVKLARSVANAMLAYMKSRVQCVQVEHQ